MTSIKLIPLKVSRKESKFNIIKCISDSLTINSEQLQNGDVLTISSKFIALSEGRYKNLNNIKVSSEALDLSNKYNIDPQLSELIYEESDKIFSGSDGFVLTFKNGIVVPNAGIDTSNIMPGYAILYPENPLQSAQFIKKELDNLFKIKLGVIITDSRLMPTRIGTTGVAIACVGINPIQDERGKNDLFGNSILVTQKAIADNLSSASQILMGECDESIPIVIVRDGGFILTDDDISNQSFSVGLDKCIFIKGLSDLDF